jgi:hypothetical protein
VRRKKKKHLLHSRLDSRFFRQYRLLVLLLIYCTSANERERTLTSVLPRRSSPTQNSTLCNRATQQCLPVEHQRLNVVHAQVAVLLCALFDGLSEEVGRVCVFAEGEGADALG